MFGITLTHVAVFAAGYYVLAVAVGLAIGRLIAHGDAVSAAVTRQLRPVRGTPAVSQAEAGSDGADHRKQAA